MENTEYVEQFIAWLTDAGFVNDRSFEKPNIDGGMIYSLVKGIYRFRIYLDFNKMSDMFPPLRIDFLDCSKEFRGEPLNFIGWMGQDVILSFKKQITKALFNEICNHYY